MWGCAWPTFPILSNVPSHIEPPLSASLATHHRTELPSLSLHICKVSSITYSEDELENQRHEWAIILLSIQSFDAFTPAHLSSLWMPLFHDNFSSKMIFSGCLAPAWRIRIELQDPGFQPDSGILGVNHLSLSLFPSPFFLLFFFSPSLPLPLPKSACVFQIHLICKEESNGW